MLFLFDLARVVFGFVSRKLHRNCTLRFFVCETAQKTAQKLHKIMLFLFGVACVVFVSVFGKPHKNCTGTAHVFGVLLAGMRMGSSASCFCFCSSFSSTLSAYPIPLVLIAMC